MNDCLNFDRHRRRQDYAVTTVVSAVCGLGFAGAVAPAIERGITVALLTLVGIVAAVVVARWVARVVRERREDRADALAGSAWRAAHLPDHPLTARDRATARDPRGWVGMA